MRNRLYELQAGIKRGKRNINNLRYEDDTTLIVESEEELKSLLMRVKEESGIRHHYFMANRRGKGRSSDFLFFDSKITADGDCSHDIRRRLLLGRKAMTNLNSVLKNRNITLPTKGHTVKAMVFPVVTYGYESWTIKKAEHQRIDAFKLWCWRRLLKVPWTARKSNQSILS